MPTDSGEVECGAPPVCWGCVVPMGKENRRLCAVLPQCFEGPLGVELGKLPDPAPVESLGHSVLEWPGRW